MVLYWVNVLPSTSRIYKSIINRSCWLSGLVLTIIATKKNLYFLGAYPCDPEHLGKPWCPEPPNYNRPLIAEFYSISYMHLGTVGFLSTVIFGSIVSWMVYCVKRHSPNDLPHRVFFPAIDRRFERTNHTQLQAKEVTETIM